MNKPSARTAIAAIQCAALALAVTALPAAHAGRSPLMPADAPPAYLQECGSCHVAYPPALLPARSWQRLMSGLDAHYGIDASLDAATQQQLSDWLRAYAGTYKRVREEPPQDRITRSAWYLRKHDEIARGVWTDPAVKSPANCAACHGGAEGGVFSERDLRFPAGLDPRYRGPWND
jgi:cytochrome c553